RGPSSAVDFTIAVQPFPSPGGPQPQLNAAPSPFLGCSRTLLGLPTEVCMLIAIPRSIPTAAVVGLLLAWVPYDVASAAKPRDFGTGSPGRPLHTATPATAQTSINSSPVCTAPFEQSTPTIIADGSGDDIVVWTDGRSGNLDI